MPQHKISTKLARPKGVLFDWDGTLADTVPIIQENINRVLKLYGHGPAPFGSGVMATVAGSNGLFKALLGEERGAEAKQTFEEYLDTLYKQEHGPVGPHLARDGAREILEYLQVAGIPTCVVTNKRRYRFQMECTAMGFDSLLTHTVTLNDVINRKPHPEMAETAAQLLGLSPHEVWFVGDHQVDSECAKRAGATAIHLACGYEASTAFLPDVVVSDLQALLGILKTLK